MRRPRPPTNHRPSVCIVSIVRLVTLVEVETEPLIDPTYSSATLSYWTSIEVNAATSCACIMTLKPLIVRIFPRLLTESSPFRSVDMPHFPTTTSSASSQLSLGRRAGPDLLERGGGTPMVERRSRTKSGLLPWMEEGDAGLLEDVLEAGGNETRRSDSVSTAGREEDVAPRLGQGTLRAPPKAHLGLSIKVTKTVQVTKWPRSPG